MGAEAVRIALVGVGKIARDQHIPALAGDPRFDLVATADPAGGVPGYPDFPSLEALLAAGPGVDAVSLCTPPQGRGALVTRALDAGLHVMIEKPPAATLSEIRILRDHARRRGRTLFASWHSREAGAVAPARAWLRGRRVTNVAIVWREDIRRWHPGQDWILGPGGYGVFDPAINALSIVTAILPKPLQVAAATMVVPAGRQAPISASLKLVSGGAGGTAELDFLHGGEQRWDIAIETDGGPLAIRRGGRILECEGRVETFANAEYPRLYGRFAALIDSAAHDVDAAPSILVADAFLLAERIEGPAFAW